MIGMSKKKMPGLLKKYPSSCQDDIEAQLIKLQNFSRQFEKIENLGLEDMKAANMR